MDLSYVSMEKIVPELIDHAGYESTEYIDEDWVKGHANDALEKIIPYDHLEEAIDIIEIEDYRGNLDPNFKSVIQAAYRKYPDRPVLREEIVQWSQNVLGSNCTIKVNLDCPGDEPCDDDVPPVIVDVSTFYNDAHPEHYYKHMKHYWRKGNLTDRGHQSHICPLFTLMTRKSNNFGNIPYHISDCININYDSVVEYNIKPPLITVNFQEGQVLLSYIRVQTDDNGWRMIPDDAYVIRAIVDYVLERSAYMEYRRSKGRNDRIFWMDMKAAWQSSVLKARSRLSVPSADSFHVFLRNHWMKVLPYWRYQDNMDRKRGDLYNPPFETYNIHNR